MSATLDPRAIEREIGMIRERESNPYSSGIKTNLFNLVILAEGAGEAAAASPALEHMLGRRPARIITVEGSAGSPAQGMQAAVSGRCFPDTHSRGVCFEEVRITTAEPAVDVGAWVPLLIRDIPVYAWILGLPTAARLAPVLEAAEYIDTLIVDTSTAMSPDAALEVLRALQAARGAARRVFMVSDFSWRRTFPLRAQAARAFDPPEERTRLQSIREVSTGSLAPAEALLFFLWLAARLGWQPGKTGGSPFVDAAGNGVSLLTGQAQESAAGRQMSAEIRFDTGAPLTLCATPPAEGGILLAEVDSLRQDLLFDDALAIAEASA